MTERIREAEILRAVCLRLRRQGFLLVHEYPMLGRIADICGYRDGRFVAVECKERDWGRALQQARIYQGACDDVYVALARNAITDRAIEVLGAYGIGLICVDANHRTREINAPRRAAHLVPALRRRSARRFIELGLGGARCH